MEIGRKGKYAITTFFVSNICILAIEAYTGVSFDPFYWLDLIFHAINNLFMPSMSTTGDSAQRAENTILFANFVHIMLHLLPSIVLAIVVYRLIRDE